MTKVCVAKGEADYLACKKAILALRPAINDAEYLEMLQNTLASNRQLIFVEADDTAVAAAIFETGFNLHRKRYIYIDDLSTLSEYRGNGYAGMLIDWIFEYAEQGNFNQVHLDSGVNLERKDAHRLYLNKRFVITSLHFVREV